MAGKYNIYSVKHYQRVHVTNSFRQSNCMTIEKALFDIMNSKILIGFAWFSFFFTWFERKSSISAGWGLLSLSAELLTFTFWKRERRWVAFFHFGVCELLELTFQHLDSIVISWWFISDYMKRVCMFLCIYIDCPVTCMYRADRQMPVMALV